MELLTPISSKSRSELFSPFERGNDDLMMPGQVDSVEIPTTCLPIKSRPTSVVIHDPGQFKPRLLQRQPGDFSHLIHPAEGNLR